MAGPLPLGLPWPDDHRLVSQRDSGSFHAYVHIPFCSVRCGYCDFNTYTAAELGDVSRSTFHHSLISEIEHSKRVLELSHIELPRLSSVFFGGGTPSLFAADQILAVMQSLAEVHGINPDAEVTLEANPDNVTPELLEGLRNAGVNRISFGVQSFDPEVLGVLDRTHNPDSVPRVISQAKAAGFRVSLDLIYGAPGESMSSWEATLDSALALETEHISAYSLIVEPGTKLAAKVKRGELADIDDDLNAQKYELASTYFERAGLKWYEVSNWGVPSIHNLAYWYSKNWWGYGPGAHSHIAGNRFWNRKHPTAYQGASAAGMFAQGREVIDSRTHLEERLMLELRCDLGCELELLNQLEVSKEKVSAALAQGLLTLKPERRIAVTAAGRLLIDGLVLSLLS